MRLTKTMASGAVFLCLVAGRWSFAAADECDGKKDATLLANHIQVLSAGPAGKKFVNSIGMEFIYVPAGSNTLGDAAAEDNPLHKVSLDGYFLQKTDVTQEQWFQVMGYDAIPAKKGSGSNIDPARFRGRNLPVAHVSFSDAQLFIKKLNEKEKTKRYRLPTETEWEYAFRAGTDGDFFSVKLNDIGQYAWYKCNAGDAIHPVATRHPNPWGFYDMAGNVFQWVNDWYDEKYYQGAPSRNPQGPTRGTHRVLRGASFNFPGESTHLAAAARFKEEPENRSYLKGFRIAFAEESSSKETGQKAAGGANNLSGTIVLPENKILFYKPQEWITQLPQKNEGDLSYASYISPDRSDLLSVVVMKNSGAGDGIKGIATLAKELSKTIFASYTDLDKCDAGSTETLGDKEIYSSKCAVKNKKGASVTLEYGGVAVGNMVFLAYYDQYSAGNTTILKDVLKSTTLVKKNAKAGGGIEFEAGAMSALKQSLATQYVLFQDDAKIWDKGMDAKGKTILRGHIAGQYGACYDLFASEGIKPQITSLGCEKNMATLMGDLRSDAKLGLSETYLGIMEVSCGMACEFVVKNLPKLNSAELVKMLNDAEAK